jgi:endonuclease-8
LRACAGLSGSVLQLPAPPRIRHAPPGEPFVMPEGPEIRRAADQLAKAVVGEVAQRVTLSQPWLTDRGDELSGRQVLSIKPRGKALLTRFEGDLVLYTHNQLYGKWFTCAPGKPPRTGRTLRVSIETTKRWALLYSASEIELLHERDLATHPFLRKLGPDLLDDEATPALLRRRLMDKRFRGRALGGLLLDQSFVAGIGNYLRSEILFFAGLLPGLRPKDLSTDELAGLARAMRSVVLRSYRTGGVTELAEHVRRAKAAGEPRRLWRHAVFARGGSLCRRCRTKIEKTYVAGRQFYCCADCQPV